MIADQTNFNAITTCTRDDSSVPMSKNEVYELVKTAQTTEDSIYDN